MKVRVVIKGGGRFDGGQTLRVAYTCAICERELDREEDILVHPKTETDFPAIWKSVPIECAQVGERCEFFDPLLYEPPTLK